MERKEAIEVIKKNWPDSSFTMLREALETLIPELKESEENRIKSDIQYAVRCAYGDKSEQTNKILGWIEKQVPACLSHDDEIMIRQLTEYFKTGKGLQNTNDTVVEWLTDVKRKLEKQGDKDKLIQELGEYKVKYTQEVLEKHLKTINKDDERLRKTTIAFLKDFAEQGYENAVECIDWLEKQGESTDINPSEFDLRLNKLLKQFETLPKEELANSLSFYLIVVLNDGTYVEEKQDEQNPATDKVEPKFHEGEWVTIKE